MATRQRIISIARIRLVRAQATALATAALIFCVPVVGWAQSASALAQRIQRRAEHADERTKFEKLTEREQNVLKFVARGYSAPEIGEKLFISPKTVDTYKQRINEKLGLAHRSDYVDFALKIGLLAD